MIENMAESMASPVANTLSLEDAGIIKVKEGIRDKTKQEFLCTLCNNKFVDTATHVKSKFKIDGCKGCPSCREKQRAFKERSRDVSKLEGKFIFNFIDMYGKQKQQVTVTNKNCGHMFSTDLADLVGNKNKVGVNCPLCARKNAVFPSNARKPFIEVEEFNKRMSERNEKYPDKYVECTNPEDYHGVSEELNFKCKNGHEWKEKPSRYLYGDHGCIQCKHDKFSFNYRKTLEEVKNDLRKFHGDKYIYPHLEHEYTKSGSKITIACPVHGEFKQSFWAHTRQQQGCPKCAVENSRDTKEEFIKKAVEIHGQRYDYSKVEFHGYAMDKPKVIITCKKHGDFIQHPATHTVTGSGCPKCAKTGFSMKALRWLSYISKRDNIKIQHALSLDGEFNIPTTKYRADGYCERNNTIYEFYGTIYHGDITVLNENMKCHPHLKLTARELYDKTMLRERTLEQKGYIVVSIWEEAWNKKSVEIESHWCFVDGINVYVFYEDNFDCDLLIYDNVNKTFSMSGKVINTQVCKKISEELEKVYVR